MATIRLRSSRTGRTCPVSGISAAIRAPLRACGVEGHHRLRESASVTHHPFARGGGARGRGFRTSPASADSAPMRFWRDDVRCSTPPIRPPRRPPAPFGWRSLSRSDPTSDAPCRLLGTAGSVRFRPAARVHAPCGAHRYDPRRPGRHTRDPVRGRGLHARSAFHRTAPPQPFDCGWTRRLGFDPVGARRAPVRPSFLRPRVTGWPKSVGPRLASPGCPDGARRDACDR